MPKSVIPPSPSQSDYEAGDARSEEISRAMFNSGEPFGLFETWMAEAVREERNDPNAMSLATIDKDGRPDVRIVLLKGVDERGFVFYTNANSVKGQDLTGNSVAALCFHWKSLERSVRIRGQVETVSTAESDAYFAKRSRGSQIGAWASQQSEPLEARQTLIEATDTITQKYAGQDVPRPAHWHGFRVIPQAIEFWCARPFRLHDRLVFTRAAVSKSWQKQRLYP